MIEQLLTGFRSPFYMQLFLVWAIVVIVPMGLRVHARQFSSSWWFRFASSRWPIAGLFLCGSLLSKTGIAAALLTIPIVVFSWFLLWAAIQKLHQNGWKIGPHWGDSFSLGSLSVVSTFVLADRLGYQPFGFDPVVIFLTAIHFSYAGFVLPLVAAEVSRQKARNIVADTITAGIIMGVVGLAIGITATQLGMGWTIELGSALCLAFFGCSLGFLMLRSYKQAPLLAVSGLFLIFGVCVAALYALRPIYPVALLDIPNMRAIHGTVQAFGFSTLALFALSKKPSLIAITNIKV